MVEVVTRQRQPESHEDYGDDKCEDEAPGLSVEQPPRDDQDERCGGDDCARAEVMRRQPRDATTARHGRHGDASAPA